MAAPIGLSDWSAVHHADFTIISALPDPSPAAASPVGGSRAANGGRSFTLDAAAGHAAAGFMFQFLVFIPPIYSGPKSTAADPFGPQNRETELMSPQETDRIARQIASGTPAMTIPGYARASATIRRLIDRAAQDILDEEKRKAALAAESDLENGTVKPAPTVVNAGENATPSFKLPGFSSPGL